MTEWLNWTEPQNIAHETVPWCPETFPKHFLIFSAAAAAAAKSLQSCPTLCDPRDGSPPGSPVTGILQARTLEWDAISFSNAWKWKVEGKSLSRVRLFATPWTAAHQAPPSMGFSRHRLSQNRLSQRIMKFQNSHIKATLYSTENTANILIITISAV